MFDWNDTFNACAENRTLLDGILNRGAEVTCTRTFTIFPLRYGAVGGSAERRKLLPSLPEHLNKPSRVGSLSESTYAIRPLRQGFLYVLVQRVSAGTYEWHSQYRVSEAGTLAYMNADEPWEPKRAAGQGMDADTGWKWMFKVHDVDDIKDLRLLFSPCPLTKETLRRYRSLSASRDKLVSVDIAKLASLPPEEIDCARSQDGVLTFDQLDCVADFAAVNQPRLNTLLKTQAFNPLAPPLQATQAEMRPTAKHNRFRGAAIVVDDALGITQELNAWRNASVDALDAFMALEDGEKLTNHRKFTIAFGIENIRKLVEDEAEKDYYKKQWNHGVRYSDPGYEMSNRHMVPQSARGYDNYRNPQHQREVQEAAAKRHRAESWSKYSGYIDEEMRQDFLKRYREEVGMADAAKDARASDHLLWLQSEPLLDALDTFDRNDTEQALLFEDQMGKAVAGMNATAVGEELLDRWRKAGISRENLFWRSLAQNQESMESEVNRLFGERETLKSVDPVAMQNRLKKLADLYEKSHAMLDSLGNASTGGGPPSGYLVGGAMLINTLGSSLFQSKTAAAIVDAPINKVAASVLLARLGRYAQHFRLELRNGEALSRGTVARMDISATQAFNSALRADKRGPMTEIRIGSALVILEMWNLYNKLGAVNKRSKEYVEILAALAAITAAGVEVGACAVGLAEKSGNAAVQRGAKVFGGGLRLTAGLLAGSVGVVGAHYDYSDFSALWRMGSRSISTFYLLRATAQTGAASLSVTVGLGNAGPYFAYLVSKHGTKPIFGRAAGLGLRASAVMASRMVPMLRIFFGVNALILALVLVEIFILPNDLQRFLAHSSFRKDRSKGIVASEEEEVEILQRSVKVSR
ncbi:T6SS effector BTH_I2691 family protein [Achromobacter animicus]|uniref:T6SS effector BTH_I2691 family protein n=1 Tax=Achromobacter animicus TaxID=1389935 RepID=UPI0028B1C322|nr:T6SS effector BTH_I2691 family protein [Achromobacter animicus]